MASDCGGDGGPLDWWRVFELLIPVIVSILLAWLLFRAERKSQRKASHHAFRVGVFERAYVQMHDSLVFASQKLTEGSSCYKAGDPGRQFVASAGDDVRHALSVAKSIQSPQKLDLRDALDDLVGFVEDVPASKPVLEGDNDFIRLNALARKVKCIETEVLRYIASGDMLRDVEKSAESAPATNTSDKSSTADSKSNSSS